MKKRKLKVLIALCTAFTFINTNVLVSIPNTVVVAEAATTGEHDEFQYSINGDTASITRYTGSDSNVVIPSSVTEDGKTYSVTSIGNSAFKYARTLENVKIPDSVTSIEDFAFINCENLDKIFISKSVTSIGSNPFAYCKSLKSITVDEENENYKSEDGILYNKNMDKLISYPTKKNGNLNFSDKVRTLNDYCFAGNINLQKVEISDSINSIGIGTFEGCINLTNIKLSKALTEIKDYTFHNCSKLKKIEINHGITSIGKGAFDSCTSLDDIKIANTVIEIGDETFKGCNNLKVIEIPLSVNKIGSNAFSGCTSLSNVIYPNRTNIDSVFPSGLSNSGYYYYGNYYYYYYYVYLNDNYYHEVQYVKDNCNVCVDRDNFYCNLSSDNTSWTDKVNCHFYNLNKATYYLSRNNIVKKDYTIEKTGGQEGDYSSFTIKPTDVNAKISLDNVNYSDKIDINDNHEDEKTIYIKFSDGKIGKGTISLSNTEEDDTHTEGEGTHTEGEGTHTEGEDTHTEGEDIKPQINVLSDTNTIGSSTDIYISTTTGKCGGIVSVSKDGGKYEKVDGNIYTATDNGTYTFKITSGSGLEDYKTIEVNNIVNEINFKYNLDNTNNTAAIAGYTGNESNVIIPDTITHNGVEYKVTSIKMNAFKNCNTLTNIVVPDSVTNIENYAFNYCKNLKSIKLSSNITHIANYTFANCISLESIILQEGVKSIGNYAFLNCRSLKEIKIPESVENIGDGAFLKCDNLNKIDFLRKSISSGKYLFKSCDNLNNIRIRNSKEFDIIKNKGLDINNYYVVTLNGDNYSEIQLVKKGGNSMVTENDDSYYNVYDGDNLVTDYKINNDVVYKICMKTLTTNDYNIEGNAGEGGWYCDDVKIKPSDNTCKISIDKVNWQDDITFKESLKKDQPIYIKGADGLIGKGVIAKDKIQIDRNVPSISVSGDLSSRCDNLDLSVDAKYGDSGIYKITVSKDGEEPQTVSDNKFNVNRRGNYVFTVTGGNGLESSTTVTVNNVIDYDAFECDIDENNKTAVITSYNGEDNEVYIPSKMRKDDKYYDTIGIDGFAFNYCDKVTKITIPESVKSISNGAFNGCSSLKEINIPEGVTTISEMMFYNCSSLKNIELPESITSVGESAFSGCSSLEEIKVPDTVETINNMAFSDCTLLKKVTLPGNIEGLGSEIFNGCSSIETIILNNAESTDILKDSSLNLDDYNSEVTTDENNNKIVTLNKKVQ